MSASDLMRRICVETGFLGAVGAMTGNGNIDELIAAAKRFESSEYRSIYQFLEYLRMVREKRPEQGTADSESAVKIMSIHKSKGLEFPIVIIPDLAKKINFKDSYQSLLVHPQLGVGAMYTDTEKRVVYNTVARKAIAKQMTEDTMWEELRVLYVAMTRAKEKLIMTAALADAERELEKFRELSSLPVEPGVLSATHRMIDWILLPVLQKPESEALFGNECQNGDWEINLIPGADYTPGTKTAERCGEIHAEADERTVSEIKRNLSFRYAKSEAASLPSKLTATEMNRYGKAQEAAGNARGLISRRAVMRKPDFASGGKLSTVERGSAIHLVMQHIDFEKCGSENSVREEIKRLVENSIITQDEADAAAPGAIVRFFESDIGRRIRKADKLYREFKFSLLVPACELLGGECEDEILLQGVTDCCIEENGELTVVDYKTDRVYGEALMERAAEYEKQLNAYALAMEKITGKRVRQKLLWFFSEEKEVIL